MNDKSTKISNIVDNLRRIFQILNEQSKKVENETGLTSPQLWAIKVINEHSPIKVSELASRLYLHPATVVGILDRLETHKLVKRRRCLDDRRVVWIELTEKGNELVKFAPEVAQGLLVAGLEGAFFKQHCWNRQEYEAVCKNIRRSENSAETNSFLGSKFA